MTHHLGSLLRSIDVGQGHVYLVYLAVARPVVSSSFLYALAAGIAYAALLLYLQCLRLLLCMQDPLLLVQEFRLMLMEGAHEIVLLLPFG